MMSSPHTPPQVTHASSSLALHSRLKIPLWTFPRVQFPAVFSSSISPALDSNKLKHRSQRIRTMILPPPATGHAEAPDNLKTETVTNWNKVSPFRCSNMALFTELGSHTAAYPGYSPSASALNQGHFPPVHTHSPWHWAFLFPPRSQSRSTSGHPLSMWSSSTCFSWLNSELDFQTQVLIPISV